MANVLVILTGVVCCAQDSGRSYSASELFRLNHQFWGSIYSLDIEYSMASSVRGEELVTLPTARWVFTSEKERLKTYLWFHEDTDTTPSNTQSITQKNPKVFIHPLDFIRETGKQYWAIRGEIPDQVAAGFFDEQVKRPLVACVNDLYPDPWLGEQFSLYCPGNNWLHLREGFNMRFSNQPNPRDETLASFAAKHRTSPPILSFNSRKERVWTFRIFPKIHEGNTSDDTLYIEVGINESRRFVLEKLTYYGSHDMAWKNSEGKFEKKISRTDWEVVAYYTLKDEISFPKEIKNSTYAVEESPENGMIDRYFIEKVKINEPIAGTIFDFEIPPYTKVGYYPHVRKEDGSTFLRESIWGPDNKPLVTFESEEEFDAYMKAEWEKYNTFPLPDKGIPLYRIIFVTLGIVMILIGLILHYRSKRK